MSNLFNFAMLLSGRTIAVIIILPLVLGLVGYEVYRFITTKGGTPISGSK